MLFLHPCIPTVQYSPPLLQYRNLAFRGESKARPSLATVVRDNMTSHGRVSTQMIEIRVLSVHCDTPHTLQTICCAHIEVQTDHLRDSRRYAAFLLASKQ